MQVPPRLMVAATRFGVIPDRMIQVNTAQLPKEVQVVTPLKVTMTLLDDGTTRLCVVSLDWTEIPRHVALLLRRNLGELLKIPVDQVIFFNSHNHSDVPLIIGDTSTYEWGMPPYEEPRVVFNAVGQELADKIQLHGQQLAENLEPVHVCWAVGHEDRITYNRKGRHPDGTAYFMREEDRLMLGPDFRGDVETAVPLVVFKNSDGKPVAAWIHFTGHPVTSFHPERPFVHGDYPQVACDTLARALGDGREVPVGFFQGCAGEINSKGMFRGGTELAVKFGEMLGQSCINAMPHLVESVQDGLDFTTISVNLPLHELPSGEVLENELEEIDDFLRRAKSGDPDTVTCVGLNFPRDLSPAYRAGLVTRIRYWTEWAIAQRRGGIAAEIPRVLPMELWAFRVGDVGIIAMPSEPFQGIGREIRAASPFPLTISCGYANYAIGYVPDDPNVGDGDYMSAFHRYSASHDQTVRPRPPFAKPGGSVIAKEAVRVLRKMAEGR